MPDCACRAEEACPGPASHWQPQLKPPRPGKTSPGDDEAHGPLGALPCSPAAPVQDVLDARQQLLVEAAAGVGVGVAEWGLRGSKTDAMAWGGVGAGRAGAHGQVG